jgi:nucleoside-diphosphate-sugar epimerase
MSTRDESPLHVVLGATGGIGGAVTAELARRGVRVRAVSRRVGARVPTGAEALAADLTSVDGAVAACAGARVVYHCAQPPYTDWPKRFPPLTEAVIQGAARAGARLVFADNLYAYGPVDGPMTEATPERAEGPKGRTRVAMAQRLRSAHEAGDARVTIGRASDCYGPGGVQSAVGESLLGPAVRGRRARWPGSLDQLHTLNYLEDVARALVVLAERDDAYGRVWHLPAAEPITGRAFLELVFGQLGRPPKVGTLSRGMVRALGVVVPMVRELRETLYQFERPFVSDASAFQRAFGPFEPTGHTEAVARTVAWFRQR